MLYAYFVINQLAVTVNASTYEIDRRVRQYALDLQDTVLLAKLDACDMIAIEAKYHKSCLTALYYSSKQYIWQ